MWQSNRSRSTGWHSPAVPPLRSASHPGEKTSEQPLRDVRRLGLLRRPALLQRDDVLFVGRVRLDARGLAIDRCQMLHETFSGTSSSSNCRRNSGLLLGDLAVDLETGVRPAANPLAVVQVGPVGRSVARVRLVIAAAGADRPRPAGLAVGLARRCDALSRNVLLLLPRSTPSCTVPSCVLVRAGEAMAERDVAVGRDAHQADAGAARIRLGMALVQSPAASRGRSRSRDAGSASAASQDSRRPASRNCASR